MGITPIYMGSTRKAQVCTYVTRDHPHIHGEHQKSKPLNMPNVGSPPYTWGALVLRIAKLIKFRITPIYMGSTVVVNPIMVDIRDHPHIHGEHSVLAEA